MTKINQSRLDKGTARWYARLNQELSAEVNELRMKLLAADARIHQQSAIIAHFDRVIAEYLLTYEITEAAIEAKTVDLKVTIELTRLYIKSRESEETVTPVAAIAALKQRKPYLFAQNR